MKVKATVVPWLYLDLVHCYKNWDEALVQSENTKRYTAYFPDVIKNLQEKQNFSQIL